jgi:hypothetical protein
MRHPDWFDGEPRVVHFLNAQMQKRSETVRNFLALSLPTGDEIKPVRLLYRQAQNNHDSDSFQLACGDFALWRIIEMSEDRCLICDGRGEQVPIVKKEDLILELLVFVNTYATAREHMRSHREECALKALGSRGGNIYGRDAKVARLLLSAPVEEQGHLFRENLTPDLLTIMRASK